MCRLEERGMAREPGVKPMEGEKERIPFWLGGPFPTRGGQVSTTREEWVGEYP